MLNNKFWHPCLNKFNKKTISDLQSPICKGKSYSQKMYKVTEVKLFCLDYATCIKAMCDMQCIIENPFCLSPTFKRKYK